MKLGIVITTYQKQDGTTPILLRRAIDSVVQQTHKDYQLIVVGDRYDDDSEFVEICATYQLVGRLIYYNLPLALERQKYAIGTRELWSSGGVNARNYGIDLALSLGLSYICHLDHDDYWHPQHLEIINHTIEATNNPSFIYTCGTYFDSYLPNVELNNEIVERLPTPAQTIHSSVCIDHRQVPIKYRDVYGETGICEPADADMWSRTSDYITLSGLKSYLVTSLTCYHPTEQQ